jgi:hypothetical protein
MTKKRKARAKKAATESRPKSEEVAEAESAFTKGVLTRGEAAEDGEELEPGQTHVRVEHEDDDDAPATVERRRFSAF